MSAITKETGRGCLPLRRMLTEGVCPYEGGWQRMSAITKEADRWCLPLRRRLAEGVCHYEEDW